MFTCPSCGADAAGRTACPCGADLTVLAALDALPDSWFNRGLAAIGEGAAGEALEWISACCAARPTDAAARRAQARLWARLGHAVEAAASLERAAALDPAAPELAEIRAAIADLARPPSKRSSKARAALPAGRARSKGASHG